MCRAERKSQAVIPAKNGGKPPLFRSPYASAKIGKCGWLAFLDTVRTKNYDEVLAFGAFNNMKKGVLSSWLNGDAFS